MGCLVYLLCTVKTLIFQTILLYAVVSTSEAGFAIIMCLEHSAAKQHNNIEHLRNEDKGNIAALNCTETESHQCCRM